MQNLSRDGPISVSVSISVLITVIIRSIKIGISHSRYQSLDQLANGQLKFWLSGGQEAIPYQNNEVSTKCFVYVLIYVTLTEHIISLFIVYVCICML